VKRPAEITVLGGDFAVGSDHALVSQGGRVSMKLKHRGLWGRVETIPAREIKTLVLDALHRPDNRGAALAVGLFDGLVVGPLGAILGYSSVGPAPLYMYFRCQLKDGREFRAKMLVYDFNVLLSAACQDKKHTNNV